MMQMTDKKDNRNKTMVMVMKMRNNGVAATSWERSMELRSPPPSKPDASRHHRTPVSTRRMNHEQYGFAVVVEMHAGGGVFAVIIRTLLPVEIVVPSSEQ
jgi:hypothetical protein